MDQDRVYFKITSTNKILGDGTDVIPIYRVSDMPRKRKRIVFFLLATLFSQLADISNEN